MNDFALVDDMLTAAHYQFFQTISGPADKLLL
jgi:hypothetical protein